MQTRLWCVRSVFAYCQRRVRFRVLEHNRWTEPDGSQSYAGDDATEEPRSQSDLTRTLQLERPRAMLLSALSHMSIVATDVKWIESAVRDLDQLGYAVVEGVL